jgi:hypothetical protein
MSLHAAWREDAAKVYFPLRERFSAASFTLWLRLPVYRLYWLVRPPHSRRYEMPFRECGASLWESCTVCSAILA